MTQRLARFGLEEVGVNTQRIKRFKFGNAQERAAESFLLLPQLIGGTKTSLGMCALDVAGVRILIGVRALRKLGAKIHIERPSLELTKVYPGAHLPLKRGSNGHLLLDLCCDWLEIGKENPADLKEQVAFTSSTSSMHVVHVADDMMSDFSSGLHSVLPVCHEERLQEHEAGDGRSLKARRRIVRLRLTLAPVLTMDRFQESLNPKLTSEVSEDIGKGRVLNMIAGLTGEEQEQVQDQPGPLRLDSSAVQRSPRQEVLGGAVHGTSCPRTLQAGESERKQCPRSLDLLPELPELPPSAFG